MDGCTLTGFAFLVIQATLHCPPPAVPVARFCAVAKMIRYAPTDTAETRRQVRAHNAAVRAACRVR